MSAPPVARVSLPNLLANYRTIQKAVAPAAVAAVVKANAYGLGAAIAPCLADAGCRLFFVAWPQEGQAVRHALREAGHEDAHIVVFNGFAADSTALYRLNRLIPVLNTQQQILLCRNSNGLLPAMLQVETGMHRSGFSGNPDALQGVRLQGIFSHLACADVPAHPLNATQLQQFEHWKGLFPGVPASLGASWGSLALPPAYHGDFVRAGAALYGAIPHVALQPVVEVHAPILEVRHVDTGGSVGYGASHVAPHPVRVATLGIGYADGYPRCLGNGKGMVMIGGLSLPVIGRVSMDMLTVDVTALPVSLLDRTATAAIYGAHYSVNDAARDAGTIGYEILTRLGGRLSWVYNT